MRIIIGLIGLASSQIMFTIMSFAIAVWFDRQLRLLRNETTLLHQEVLRLKIRSDMKKR
jgi:hypothetical protein